MGADYWRRALCRLALWSHHRYNISSLECYLKHPSKLASFIILFEGINCSFSFKIGGIVNNTLRPPVPETCDPEWRSLMEQCWSSDPSERPSFTVVVNRLRAMATALAQKAQQSQAQK